MPRRRTPHQSTFRPGLERLEDRVTPTAGALDPTFSDDGRLAIDIGPNPGAFTVNAMVVQPDGKIILAGESVVPVSGRDFTVVRLNTDGSLDTTFDGDGIRTVAVSPTSIDIATAVVVQSDGKIVLGGNFVVSIPISYNFAAVRLNADGSLDTTFSGDGIVGPIAGTGSATAVAIKADGKIVLAGSSNVGGGTGGLYPAFGTAVLNANGSLDTSFSGDGVFSFEPSSVLVAGGYERAVGVAVTASGQILVGGTSYGTASVRNATLVRLNANGTFDPTFDGDGIALHPSRVLGRDTANAAALQPDGKIIVAGYSSYTLASNTDFALARVNPDGTLDPTFGDNGIVITNLAGTDAATAVAVQPDGKIVVAGGSNQSAASLDTTAAVARYNADGSLDTTFGSGGILNLNLGTTNEVFNAVVLQPDGKIVLGGSIRTAGGTNYDFAVVRLNANGSYDTSFGVGGLVRLAIGTTDEVFSLARLSDGRILASGRSDSRGAVVRLNTNGSLDITFGTAGIAIFGGIGPNQMHGFTGMALQADGKLVFSGTALGPGSSGVWVAVALLNANGSPDTSFDGDGVKLVTPGGGTDVTIDVTGRIVVGGTATNDFSVARLLSDGTLDSSFDGDGLVTVDFRTATYG